MAPPPAVRNVLLILTDQHRAGAAGFAGDPFASTPHLDALARRAAVFTAAHTPSPVCVPARQSLLTGRYPHAHGALSNRTPLNPGETTLGHLAAAHGMATGAIGKMHFVGPDRHHGFAERWDYDDYARLQPEAAGDAASGMASRGRYGVRADGTPLPTLPATNPLDHAYLGGPSPFPAERHVESYVTRESIRFLEAHRHEPFFLVSSYFKPHDPMAPPSPFWERFAEAGIPVPGARAGAGPGAPRAVQRMQQLLAVDALSDEAWLAAARGYYGNLAFVDAEIGRLLDALDALGLAGDTLVVYTSDHGEMIGAREYAGKLCFYDEAWRVPLLVAWPGNPSPGRTAPALADLVDLFPTIAAAAGLPLPPARHGVSLWPLLGGEVEAARDHVFSQFHVPWATRPCYGVRTLEWKLALYDPGDEQLFDLGADPAERHNRFAQEPQRAAMLQRLLARDLALD